MSDDLGWYQRLADRARERAFVRQVEAWLNPEPDPTWTRTACWGTSDTGSTWTTTAGNERDYCVSSGGEIPERGSDAG